MVSFKKEFSSSYAKIDNIWVAASGEALYACDYKNYGSSISISYKDTIHILSSSTINYTEMQRHQNLIELSSEEGRIKL